MAASGRRKVWTKVIPPHPRDRLYRNFFLFSLMEVVCAGFAVLSVSRENPLAQLTQIGAGHTPMSSFQISGLFAMKLRINSTQVAS